MSAAPARAARAHNSTSGERAAQEELGPASSYGVDKQNERAVDVAKEDRPHKRPCLAALLADPAWAREVPARSTVAQALGSHFAHAV